MRLGKSLGNKLSPISSSFRDPSGFLFRDNGKIYRTISPIYKHHFDTVFSSGLYDDLTKNGMLISHRDVTPIFKEKFSFEIYKVIEPVQLSFVSYPYEWCFSQLKDAAILTLSIQKKALIHDMILKDATPYNIQFYKGDPILIDTLSFEKYEEGKPWIAYRQFCEMFLAPLCLAAYLDDRLLSYLRVFLEGIPLDLAVKLLPLKARLSMPLLLHIYFHARSQKISPRKYIEEKSAKLSKHGLLGIIDSLESAIRNLRLPEKKTVWSNYYQETNYTPTAMEGKRKIVASFLGKTGAKSVWDLGANTGEFSNISAKNGIDTVAMDFDYGAVERLYRKVRDQNLENILPLRVDFTNPSPGIGWASEERESLFERGPVDCIMALALIHHLAIGHNIPFDLIASYFQSIANYLIIEFVPKSDSQTQRILSSREDIFTKYSEEFFENEFEKNFKILNKEFIPDSKRTLYLMQRK